MKRLLFLLVLFSLLPAPTAKLHAQSSSASSPTTTTFDTTGFPQWAKDLRRFDIIAFGSFPFSIFFVTVISDSIRWNNKNGMDMSEQGRRYAPWPLRAAGAYEMSNDEYKKVILMSAGVSLGIALVDILIVNGRRSRERRRLESLPTGTYEIEITPYSEQVDEAPIIIEGDVPDSAEE